MIASPAKSASTLFVISLVCALAGVPAQAVQRGILVETVTPDSVGAKAGLRVEDRLLTYDGQTLVSPYAFQALAENTFGQREIVLTFQRGASPRSLTVPQVSLGVVTRPDLTPEALRLYQEGKALAKAKKPEGARQKWLVAEQSAESNGDKVTAAWLIDQIGSLQEVNLDWKDAEASYLAGWELVKTTHDSTAQSAALFRLGGAAEQANEPERAAEWFRQALQVDTASGYEFWQGNALYQLGVISSARGGLAIAEDYFEKALAIREKLAPNSLDVAAVNNILGGVAYDHGDLAIAEDHFNKALAIREKLAPNSLDVATTLNNLGNVASDHGDLADAEVYYKRALAIEEKQAPNSLDVAAMLNSVGGVAYDRGDLAPAEDYNKKALAIQSKLAPNSRGVAVSLQNLGAVAYMRGDLAIAEDYYKKALAIEEKLAPVSQVVAVILDNLGSVAHARGDLDTAKDFHKKASAIRERLAPNSQSIASRLDTRAYDALG
jgi:tetratricopeptide (TPR) repeat protein